MPWTTLRSQVDPVSPSWSVFGTVADDQSESLPLKIDLKAERWLRSPATHPEWITMLVEI
jgi:hypothetical protein